MPIIAMTASAMASDREVCLEAGMNDHVAKPIEPDQLFGVLLRWIGGDVKLDKARHSVVTNSAASDYTLDIPGVDVRAGLRRTGGNRQYYESLLRKFADQQANTVSVVAAASARAVAPRLPAAPFKECAARSAVAPSPPAKAARTPVTMTR